MSCAHRHSPVSERRPALGCCKPCSRRPAVVLRMRDSAAMSRANAPVPAPPTWRPDANPGRPTASRCFPQGRSGPDRPSRRRREPVLDGRNHVATELFAPRTMRAAHMPSGYPHPISTSAIASVRRHVEGPFAERAGPLGRPATGQSATCREARRASDQRRRASPVWAVGVRAASRTASPAASVRPAAVRRQPRRSPCAPPCRHGWRVPPPTARP